MKSHLRPLPFHFNAAALLGLGAAYVLLGAVEAKAVNIGAGPYEGTFSWSNPSGPPATASPTFELTVSSPSIISVALEDSFVVGDIFQLILNGTPLTASTVGSSADGSSGTNPLLGNGLIGGSYFYGLWNDVALAPGLNTFSINTTSYAPGFTAGGAYAYFSSVSQASVPGPLPLFGTMAAFGYSRKLRAKIKLSSTFSLD